jgi:hypothetical protein
LTAPSRSAARTKSCPGDHRVSRFSTSKNHALHDRSAYAKRATDLGNTHAFRVKLTNALFNGGLYRATTKLDATLVIWSISPMKRCLATFAIATSLFAPVAQANDGLEAKVRTYVPVVSLAKECDIRINDATLGDHRAMLEAVKSDPNADKLAFRVHYETQTAYIKARDGGQRVAFCKDFIAANSQYAKARFTAVVEEHMSDVSTSVQKAIAHNVCGAPPAKLSKADWKPYALVKKMLQNEQKLAKENAETNGWNVTEETTAVTEQFCAAVKTR